ncbi:MAG: hypothetical protein ACI9EF_001734 [Pseudohongiellaceae bacterium]|jgi:uncharacterized protein (DUF1800 family)
MPPDETQNPSEPRAAGGASRRASRRALIRGALGAGGALLAASRSPLMGGVTLTSGAGRKVLAKPLPQQSAVRFLVDRITCGFNHGEWQRAEGLGYAAYLDEQLHPDLITDTAVTDVTDLMLSLHMTAQQLVDTYLGTVNDTDPQRELKSAVLIRQTYSKRQLFERMVEFWTDHFNIDHNKQEDQYLKTVDDREVIRTHALGHFPELLKASAHSSAMLFYLDNVVNVAGTAQENYARELLELHTLGLTGAPFDEDDVKVVARCLTGWTMHSPSVSPPGLPGVYGEFRFVQANHDIQAPKVFLGQPILAPYDKSDGDQVLNMIISHRATAEHISRKMIAWLLTETPSDTLVQRVADVYDSTGGSIKAMIRAIFQPWSPGAALVAATVKFRRPQHLIVSLLRSMELTVTDWTQIGTALNVLGHRPFDWPAPNGYPDGVGVWGSSLLPRWGFASQLIDNTIPTVTVSDVQLQAVLQTTGAPTLLGAIDQLFSGGRLSPQDLAPIQAHVDSFATVTPAVVREAIALAASAPSYQLY